MHTRRVGAFLVGAWLLGTVIVWFLTSQSLVNVERILSAPPAPLAKEFESMGPDFSRQMLRYQALQHNRHVSETWEVMQLGLAGALLATSFLTAHRSRFLIIGTVLMGLIVTLMTFVLTPAMTSTGRAFDFLPPSVGLVERDSFQFYQVWHRVFEILKTAIGVAIAARLLFDRYNWRDKLVPSTNRDPHRRRRRPSPSAGGGGDQQPAAEA